MSEGSNNVFGPDLRPCPLCGYSEIKVQFERHNLQIVCCGECSFVYVGNPIKDSAYSDQENIKSIERNSGAVHFRHHVIKKKLDLYFNQRESVRVLEIGCGGGALGQLILNAKNQEKYQYLGYEPSAPRAQYASAKGVKVENGFFIAPPEQLFDAIIMDNVLEHIINPREIISLVSNSLSQDGMVIVIVPNLHDVRRFLPKWKAKHYWRPKKHVSYFTFHHLGKFFAESNMRLHHIEPYIGANVKFMLNALPGMVGISPLGLYCYATF